MTGPLLACRYYDWPTFGSRYFDPMKIVIIIIKYNGLLHESGALARRGAAVRRRKRETDDDYDDHKNLDQIKDEHTNTNMLCKYKKYAQILPWAKS